MRTPPQRYRRSVVEFRPGQMGDATSGDAAGRDIYHGLDGATLLRLLEGQAHERALVAASIERLAEQLRGHELMQAKRDQADQAERARRQDALDDALAAITATAARHAAELARLRRASITGGLILLGIIAVVAILVSREAGWVARAAYDAYLGSPL